MKFSIICMLSLVITFQAGAQVDIEDKLITAEFSLGYSNSGFYGYKDYKRAGGYDDSDFEKLNKFGHGVLLRAKVTKALNQKNSVFMGFGLGLEAIKVNTIGGWTGEVYETERLILPQITTEIGHRYQLCTISGIDVSLSNSIALGYKTNIDEYWLKNLNFYYKPGLHLDNFKIKTTKFFMDLNYGVGLFNASTVEWLELRSNGWELQFGVSKEF